MHQTLGQSSAPLCRFFNNIATNCADPSRSDYHESWCASFQAQCAQLRNTTGAAQAAVRQRGKEFLGAAIDLPCKTWQGAPAVVVVFSASRGVALRSMMFAASTWRS